jgi:hypothetical protein
MHGIYGARSTGSSCSGSKFESATRMQVVPPGIYVCVGDCFRNAWNGHEQAIWAVSLRELAEKSTGITGVARATGSWSIRIQIFLLSSPGKRLARLQPWEFQITLAIALGIPHASIQSMDRVPATTSKRERKARAARAWGLASPRTLTRRRKPTWKDLHPSPRRALYSASLGFLGLVPGFRNRGPLAAQFRPGFGRLLGWHLRGTFHPVPFHCLAAFGFAFRFRFRFSYPLCFWEIVLESH